MAIRIIKEFQEILDKNLETKEGKIITEEAAGKILDHLVEKKLIKLKKIRTYNGSDIINHFAD
jgi:hypothetical protein